MDELITEWNGWREKVEALAELCMNNPERAQAEGVEPRLERLERQPAYGRRTALAPVNVRAGWLRGAATKLVPEKFIWQVTETIGGGAALLLIDCEEVPKISD